MTDLRSVGVIPPAAVWVRCVDCDDWWCRTHELHVYDCACPPLEAWTTDPYGYEDEGPACDATTRQTTEGQEAAGETA